MRIEWQPVLLGKELGLSDPGRLWIVFQNLQELLRPYYLQSPIVSDENQNNIDKWT